MSATPRILAVAPRLALATTQIFKHSLIKAVKTTQKSNCHTLPHTNNQTDRDHQGRDQSTGTTQLASPPSPRKAILVLGMHRSGTSALTAVLGFLGCDLPELLMPAGPENEKGFFESNRVTPLNEKILASAGSIWFDWSPIHSNWFQSPEAAQFHDQAIEVLHQEFGTSELFVLKDPRICRLLPFWLKVLEADDCQPLIIHIFRAPSEVAASLAKAQSREPQSTLLLWLRHVLDAEANTRGRPRMFTNYDTLMDNWETVATQFPEVFGVELPRDAKQAAPEVTDFLTPSLRHFTYADSSSNMDALPEWVSQVYAIMQKWAATNEDPADHSKLNTIRAAFDEAPANYGPAFQKIQALYESVTNFESQADELQTVKLQQAKLTSTLQLRDLRVKDLTTQQVENQDQINALQTEQDTLLQQQDKLTSTLQLRDLRVKDLTHLQKETCDQVSKLQAEVNHKQVENSALQAQTRAVQQQLSHLHASTTKLESDLENHIEALHQQRAELLHSTSWKITSPLRWLSRTLSSSQKMLK